jgi:hypothetical protein
LLLLSLAVKPSSGFTSSRHEFVTRCQETSLIELGQILQKSALRKALEVVLKLLGGMEKHLQLVA